MRFGQIYHRSRILIFTLTDVESSGVKVISTKLVSPVFVMFLEMFFLSSSRLDRSTLSLTFNGHSLNITKSLVL